MRTHHTILSFTICFYKESLVCVCVFFSSSILYSQNNTIKLLKKAHFKQTLKLMFRLITERKKKENIKGSKVLPVFCVIKKHC